MLFSEGLAILADDLTGANETALQFLVKGCSTKILTDYNSIPKETGKTQVWAISTESRNIEPEEAKQKSYDATKAVLNNLHAEHLYKKTDSAIRGNIAMEIMGILEASEYEAALIIPAFPNEGLITIGGYHMLKGVPIERTEFARDSRSPIYESHIPSVLRMGLMNNEKDIVSLIDFGTVKQGAGPILAKLNDMLAQGKKLIVADAVSSVDIEQVILALKKCTAKVLPCGSAGAAQALRDILFPETVVEKKEIQVPKLPKLVVSGSASQLSATQIKRLESDEDVDNIYFIEITPEQILGYEHDDIVARAIKNLNHENTVVIHTSTLFSNPDAMTVMLFEQEISREAFISMICDYLAEITQVITGQKDVILITVGGETSRKCLEALGSSCLEAVDAVSPSILLCKDFKSGYFVTKPGNVGSINTMVEILKYFNK